MRGSRWWKLVGLAGLVGVAATGAIATRNERRRRSYTPEEVRSVLHERYARAAAAQDGKPEVPLVETSPGWRSRLRAATRRIRKGTASDDS